MYTECPHCHAIFRVTQKILKAANGKVRCGECKAIFQAVKPPGSGATQAPEPTPSGVSVTADTAPDTAAAAQTVDDQAVNDEDSAKPALSDNIEAEAPAEEQPPEVKLNSEKATSGYDADDIRTALKQKQPDAISSQNSFHHEADPQPSDAQAVATDNPDYPDESLASSTKDLTSALPGYMPVTAPVEVSSRRSSIWLKLLALLLALLLGAQYLIWNRNTLSSNPTLKPLLEKLCLVAGCQVDGRRDLERLHLKSHGVYSHPTVADALMIKGEIINQAEFSQPFPIIEVSFSDLRGKSVALRRFGPSEYLDPQQQNPETMPSNQAINILLEVADPGKHALAFEFEFL